jgi:hypothetical protein
MSIRQAGLVVVLSALSGALWAQRKPVAINGETPHGALMQQIGQEQDAAKKLALLDELVAKFGADPKLKNEMAWAYPQKQDLHVKAQEWDKAIDAGAKAIALDPELLGVSVAALKAAEAKKDLPLVKSWAQKTSEIARKSLATAKFPDEEDEAAKVRLDYAKQVSTYADYSLFNAAIQPGNPAVTIEMAEALKAQSPASEYWSQTVPAYVVALNQQGQTAKAVAVAEEVLAKDASSDDLMLLAANHYYSQPPNKANQEKVLLYTGQAVKAWENRAKPEGVSDGDWEKKKNASLSFSLWMNGMTLAAQGRLGDADAPLRRALPIIANDQMKALAAFNLGLGNFKAGEPAAGRPVNKAKLADAYRFFQQSAAIKSPVQGQAASNLKVIAVKYGIK